MTKIIRIGMDTSKSVFQLHGVDEAERPVLQRKAGAREVLGFFQAAADLVGMEACGGRTTGRVCRSLGTMCG